MSRPPRLVDHAAWDRVCALVAQLASDDQQRVSTISCLIPWEWTPPEGTSADWKESRAQLARLQEAVEQLGPGALACLASAFASELKCLQEPAPSDWPRVINCAVTSAHVLGGRYVKRGRPRNEAKRRLADEIARVYLNLTAETPSTEAPWPDDPGDDRYHRLVSDVFRAWGLEGWAYAARQAALRMVSRHGTRRLKSPAGT